VTRKLLYAATVALLVVVAVLFIAELSGFPRITPVVQLLAFYPYVVIAGVLAIVGAAVLRVRPLMLVAVLALSASIVLLIVARPSANLIGSAASADPATQQLRVASANVQEGQATQAVLDKVAGEPVATDLLAIIECPQVCNTAIDSVAARKMFPYRIVRSIPGARGAAVLSRTPVRWQTDPGEISAEYAGLPAVVVQRGSEEVTVKVAHPLLPWPGRLDEWSNDLAGLQRFAGTTSGPRMVLGDFNATHFHRQFRDILMAGPVSDATAGIGGTWPSSVPPWAGSQIDHILTSADFTVTAAGSWNIEGSDHRAIFADLNLTPPR
jgi:endonuclease/exonuclease/phosphatase (EEP) superfamily protein YafD